MHKISTYILAVIPILFVFVFDLSFLIPSAIFSWLIYQIVFSDHIFYSPRKNYLYDIHSSERSESSIKDHRVTLDIPTGKSSLLLEFQVSSSILGYVFDPYITYVSEGKKIKQYFERGVRGQRYLNISSLCNRDVSKVLLEFRPSFCSLSDSCMLHSFDNNSVNTDSIMVIAPHADDAEIASFGLYSQTNSHIITVTAGEIEPETFKHFNTDPEKASRIKGLVRSWDSLAVPVWGNQPYSHSIQLGYFCKQLSRMKDTPDVPVQSLTSKTDDIRTYRVFNGHSLSLSSDVDGKATWNNLVQDLTELIDYIKPTSIITPHDQIDAHPDHKLSTKALKEALLKTKHNPGHLLLYANHLTATDMHPFGPAHSAVSLPPSFSMTKINNLLSIELNKEQQVSKAIALGMMHDLRRPVSLKKKFRTMIQAIFINRKIAPYGSDPFFRKSVRSNELFIVESIK